MSQRGKTGNSRKLNDKLFRSFGRRKRPWVILNQDNEPIGHFRRRVHAEDWRVESGEGDRYRVEREISA